MLSIVGSKRDIYEDHSKEVEMSAISTRWLGGLAAVGSTE